LIWITHIWIDTHSSRDSRHMLRAWNGVVSNVTNTKLRFNFNILLNIRNTLRIHATYSCFTSLCIRFNKHLSFCFLTIANTILTRSIIHSLRINWFTILRLIYYTKQYFMHENKLFNDDLFSTEQRFTSFHIHLFTLSFRTLQLVLLLTFNHLSSWRNNTLHYTIQYLTKALYFTTICIRPYENLYAFTSLQLVMVRFHSLILLTFNYSTSLTCFHSMH
jgi:hypothetical protein